MLIKNNIEYKKNNQKKIKKETQIWLYFCIY